MVTIDKAVMSLAGVVVPAGLALGWWVSPYWFLLSAFVGLNLLQVGFTGFCPAARIFRLLGLPPGCAFR